MKKYFVINTKEGDLIVSAATQNNAKKVAEATLKDWTVSSIAFKVFPLGKKLERVKKANAKTLASLQYGDEVALIPAYYEDNFNNVLINKVKVIRHNAPMTEDFCQRLIYVGEGNFFYSGKKTRRTCSAHVNALDAFGNI